MSEHHTSEVVKPEVAREVTPEVAREVAAALNVVGARIMEFDKLLSDLDKSPEFAVLDVDSVRYVLAYLLDGQPRPYPKTSDESRRAIFDATVRAGRNHSLKYAICSILPNAPRGSAAEEEPPAASC